MSSPTRRIAVLIEPMTAYHRGVLTGIAKYAKAHDRWSFAIDLRQPWHLDPDDDGNNWAGIIAAITKPEYLEFIQRLSLPTVNVSEVFANLPYPLVTYDQVSIGQLAADHLLQTGLTRFAYVGFPAAYGCEMRGRGFAERIESHGYRCQRLENEPPQFNAVPTLVESLKALDKPVGVFACDDLRAREVIEAARLAKLSVPEDVAVVGVDNDPLINALTQPRLSSVRVPAETVGRTAAELLDEIIDGRTPPTQPKRIDPIAIAARPSSDALTIRDPDVVSAVRFIRNNADKPLQVGDLLDHVALSRRSLERRFREHLGRSPQQEIQRVHMERARTLLADTDMPIAQVAAASGFRNTDRMASVFRSVTNLTPSNYRAKFRQR